MWVLGEGVCVIFVEGETVYRGVVEAERERGGGEGRRARLLASNVVLRANRRFGRSGVLSRSGSGYGLVRRSLDQAPFWACSRSWWNILRVR